MTTKTSKAAYELAAELRGVQGKGASRRLRRTQNKVPGILYGGGEEPTLIALDHLKVLHALENEGFYSRLLTLTLEGKKQQVILKDLQRHHYKKAIMHMDFFRVKPTDVIVMRIPLHFIGDKEAPGIKDSGGVINHHQSDVEVRCQAKNLPEFVEVDVSKMQLDQIFHISDLKLPSDVESVALSYGPDHDHAVVSIHLPRVIIEEVPETKAEGEEGSEGEAAAGKGASADKGKENKEGKEAKENKAK